MNSKLNNKLQGKKNAFTIIEVVLVLAIAGLIFLIVFLALPGLQRSRRDTQRKSDLNNMAAALENAASNNNGGYPATPAAAGTAVATFLTGFTPVADPQGTAYTVKPAAGVATADITYKQGGKCIDGGGGKIVDTSAAGGTFKYAISMKLESGSVCQDGGQ